MGLKNRKRRTGRTASVTHRDAQIGPTAKSVVIEKMVESQNYLRRAKEALERARAKYPNFDALKPIMADLAMNDETGLDWGRSLDEIYGDLYFLATVGDGKWVV